MTREPLPSLKDRYAIAATLGVRAPRGADDPGLTFPNGSGRPMYIQDDREPVSELL